MYFQSTKKVYTCDCGDAYTETFSALGHNPEYYRVEPTCTQEGYECYKCTRCGTEYARETIPVTPHNHVVTGETPATCTTAGVKIYTCECGDTYTEKIPALGHNPEDYRTEPTCTEDGYACYKCTVCSTEYAKQIIPATGHSYDEEVITKPTCTEEGLKRYLDAGWEYQSSDYTEWSALQDEEIAKNDQKLDFQVETVMTDYDVTTASYKYSRFRYTVDGAVKYSSAAVDGFDGEWEYAEVPQTEGYSVAFENGALAFKAPDGTFWYNRTTGTLTQTLQKKQYRSRYLVVTLYKWAEDVSLERNPGETREYRVVNLFTYDYEKHYIVSIAPVMDTAYNNAKSIIVPANSLLTADNAEEFYGYTFSKYYKDVEKKTPWNLSTDKVTGNITVYADYTPVRFKVTFAYHDGTEITTQQVEYLKAATPPETIPLPDDYIFLGWDTDEYECVQGDLIVKARYISESDYTTVAIDKVEANLIAGTQVKLTAETAVGGKDLIWTSSDEAVAIVDANGIVTGVSEGEAVITVTVSDSGEKATCKVNVLKNTDSQLCLVTNSSLGVDEDGNIRGIKVNANTVSEVKKNFANTNIVFYNADGEVLSDSDLVGTDTEIKLVINGEVADSASVVMSGDVTGDGKINNRDAAMITRYLVGKEVITDGQLYAIDVNGDGNFNNRDAAMISRYLVGKEVII